MPGDEANVRSGDICKTGSERNLTATNGSFLAAQFHDFRDRQSALRSQTVSSGEIKTAVPSVIRLAEVSSMAKILGKAVIMKCAAQQFAW
jgi:hypothetical protein